MRHLAVACLLLLSRQAFALAEERTTSIDLGGPRRVVAKVSEDADDLTVSINMIAVQCFDQATNKRLSRDKAEYYAHEALAKYLFPPSSGSVTLGISGTTVEESTLDGNRYRLLMRVPRKGVSKKVTDKPARATKDAPSLPSEDSRSGAVNETRHTKVNLFEVKGDYVQTERLLADSMKTAIPTLAKEPSDEERQVFFRAIADLEERSDENFDGLVAEMRRNKMLLSIEADELVRQAEKDRAELLELLKKSVEAADPPLSDK